MPEASRVPANSLLPFEAQLRQAEQLARRPQPAAYAPAPAPAHRPPAAEPVEPPAVVAPPAPAPAAEAALRPDLGEHKQAAPAKEKLADPPPPAAAKPTLVVEDEGDDDNFGNRIGHAPVPTARASAGRGRQQTRAMQSDHQRMGQSPTGRPLRNARAADTASASQGDAQATSLLRQASLQKPAVQGHAADLRPRREGRSPSPRPGYGRQW
jgi:2-oxoglutarate dehydrogenase E2 component (dihydrolipoamide succinyltransferase)